MGCMQLRGSRYFKLDSGAGTLTLPTRMQVILPGSAEWLTIIPGLYNNAGTPANNSIGIRLYKGTGTTQDSFTNDTNPISFPDAASVALFQSLIPWNAPLAIIVEVYGLTPAFGPNATFDFTINAWDGVK